MRQFASQDLMIGTLPEGSDDPWAAQVVSCGDGCTNDTKGGCSGCIITPNDKPKLWSTDRDLADLQAQLAARR